MSAVRDIGDFSTDPSGGGGQAWTSRARESLNALWALNGGLLTNVAGTNAVTADVEVTGGFSAYGNGQTYALVPANTNTGAVSLNLRDSGGTLLGGKVLAGPSGAALGAGELVAGTLYIIQFLQGEDEFRLITSTGVSNVTVTGGIHLHRSLPTRLIAKIAETTDETQLVSRAHNAAYADSRIVIEGSINRRSAVGSGLGDDDTDDGFTVHLFVDGAEEQTITDAEMENAVQTAHFSFEYAPGDTGAHTYAIRSTSTLGAAYFASSTFMVLSEFSPNA